MKNILLTLILAIAGLPISTSGAFAETAKTVTDKYELTTKIEGCDIDMKQHCRDVTPGKNRQILCLVAHEDKLLDSCKVGLMESAMALQLGVATLDYAHAACENDRVKICGKVEAGGGRLIKCLKDNEPKVSQECILSLKDIGLWDAALEPAAGK